MPFAGKEQQDMKTPYAQTGENVKHVLLLTREMIPSAVLCGQVPLSELASLRRIEYRSAAPGELREDDLAWADTLVFLRSDSRWEASLAEMAAASGRDTIYVLDDDLLSVPRELSSGEFYARESTRRNIRNTMKRCSCFLTPSEELLKKYGGDFESAALIEEPALLPEKIGEKTGTEVVIGFAGSIDRAGDVDLILQDALGEILRDCGDKIRLEFFGARPALADRPGVRHIPYTQDYGDYRRIMASLRWDIGLAPMPDTSFHRCKHYNKYIEYAAYGVPGIFSDVIPYRRAVRCGENGLLVPNTREAWVNALRKLIEDEPLRFRLASAALEEARTIYSPAAAAALWEKALFRRGDAGAKKPPESFAARKRREQLLETAEKVRLYGWRAPEKALRRLLRGRKGREN